MYFNNHDIVFTVRYSGDEYQLKTYWGEYRTLRLLIENKLNIRGFGQCGGMGRCASCLIEIVDLNDKSTFLSRTEHTSFRRTIRKYSIVRFACQIPVNDDLANVTIKILGNTT